MSDASKTKKQLINELVKARGRVAELEESETERKRAVAEAQRRAVQMALIYEVGQRVSGELELEALLSEIVTAVRDAFDYYGVMLLMLDEETECLTLQSITGGYVDIFPEDLRIAIGEGMIGYAAATGETQVSRDVSKDPHYVRKADEETKSELAVPIKSGQKVIGVLDLQSDKLDAFDEIEVVTMETLSTQIATAIENARLFEEARIRAKEQAVLNELGQALTAHLSVEEVLDEAYRQASRLLDTANFYIALYDPDKDEITFAIDIAEGDIRKFVGTRQAGEGLTEYIIRNETPLLIQEDLPERMEELGIEPIGRIAFSWLGVPLMIGDRVLGVMAVQSYTTPRAYDGHDRDILIAIASQVAITLQNARLFEETQRRVREVQLLHDIGLAAASGVRLEETLQAAAEALAAEFEDIHVALMLLDPESNTLRVEASVGYSLDLVKNLRLRLGEGVTGWVAQHGEPALVPDVQLDPRYYEGASDTRSELCVPLVAGSQVIGVLNVESSRVSAFTNDDLRLLSTLASNLAVLVERARLFDNMEQMVADRTEELRESLEESAHLQEQVIEAQKQALHELSTPIIPVMERIIIMPLIGSIDTLRARDITRALLAGIREHRAKVVILDITGVSVVDSGVASHLNKTIQAARLKGTRTIVTGISDAVAETIVDLGIDWSGIETLPDLQTGLMVALAKMGRRIEG